MWEQNFEPDDFYEEMIFFSLEFPYGKMNKNYLFASKDKSIYSLLKISKLRISEDSCGKL